MACVLVVEDDKIARFPWARHMAALGYKVDIASDGFEAVEAVDPDRHTLMFCDLIMPHWDGAQVARKLRQHQIDVPVVIMAPRVDPRVISHCKAAGARGVIGKPVSQRTIREVLRQVLGSLPLESDGSHSIQQRPPTGRLHGRFRGHH